MSGLHKIYSTCVNKIRWKGAHGPWKKLLVVWW